MTPPPHDHRAPRVRLAMPVGDDRIALGAGAEFDVIRALQRRWGPRARGIGDDAAILAPPPGQRMVVSTDAFVEGIHTLPGWLTPHECGWRAATAALSDIAAMGAAPAHLLIAFTASGQWLDWLGDVADGMGDAAAAADATIVGGNLSRGPVFSITTTAIGFTPTPISRAGARAGDVVLVTGALGGPACATEALYAGRTPTSWSRSRFARPDARVAAGLAFGRLGATAMIDVSDGLVAEAGHLAAASGVSIHLDREAVPVGSDATLSLALNGGEEYELLVVAPGDAVPAMKRALEAMALPLTAIGTVHAPPAHGPPVASLLDGHTTAGTSGRVEFPPGHDHFSR